MNLSNLAGWDLYRDKLRQQVETRKNTVFFAPCAKMDETLASEYLKGEGSGIYLAMNLLELLVEAYDEELTSRQLKDNIEDA